jgi:hypothetical protein
MRATIGSLNHEAVRQPSSVELAGLELRPGHAAAFPHARRIALAPVPQSKCAAMTSLVTHRMDTIKEMTYT